MSGKSSDVRHGGCQCGTIRYELAAGAEIRLYCCHCRDCQRQSASAFGMSLIVPRDAFRLLSGALSLWETTAASGRPKRAHFCPSCGVRIFHDGGADADVISVKAGSLDDTFDLRPGAHLWTASRQPWLPLPDDVPHHEAEPPEDEA